MLNVLAGRLGNNIELNQNKDGSYYCYASVYVWPGKKGKGENAVDRDSIPVKVYAKGEQAQDLAKYEKGDTLQFVGKAIDVKQKPKGAEQEITVMGYEIKKIDHSKTILTKYNNILSEYVYDGKEKKAEADKEAVKNVKQIAQNKDAVQKLQKTQKELTR